MAAILIFTIATSARAGNIFDDNWDPPPAAHRTDPKPPASTDTPARPTAPATPAESNPRAASVARRRAIPDAREQGQARKLLKEAFAKELADRSSPARRRLAHQLLEQASKSDHNIVEQFVLLTGAIEAAGESGDLHLCLEASDRITSEFEMDELAVNADAAIKALPNGLRPAELAADNVHAGVILLDRLAAVEDFPTATRLIAALQQCAAAYPALKTLVLQHAHDVAELHSAHDRMISALAKLKSAPGDPGANLAIGRYFCFYQGQWDRGLPFLAKGSDVSLAALAQRDLDKPPAAEARAGIAEAWWNFSEKQHNVEEINQATRAVFWYRKALESASGLSRTVLQKRLWKTIRAVADPQLYVYRFNTENAPFCFDLQDPTIPDELTVKRESSSELRISGTKRSDAVKVHNRLAGHFGKAALLTVRESGGTLEAGVATDQHHINYYMLMQDQAGEITLKRLELKLGTIYSWSLSREGDEDVFEIKQPDAGQPSVIRGTNARAFGWGAECRYPGDKTDLIVKFE
jgi:hypothetical protein